MIEPRRADGGKSLAPSPEIERLVKPREKPRKKRGGLDRAAVVAPERGGRIADPLRRVAAIDPDPDDAGKPTIGKRRALEQQAGAFGAADDEIVRPFETRPPRAEVPGRPDEGHAGDEAQLRRAGLRARIDQQRARMEIAPRRHPAAASAAAAGALLACDDPQPAGIARDGAAARLGIGRVDRVETVDPPSERRGSPRGGNAQNSVCAAAMAALVKSEGARTKAMMRTAAKASTLRATTPGRSNATAGSSKYISLTIRR